MVNQKNILIHHNCGCSQHGCYYVLCKLHKKQLDDKLIKLSGEIASHFHCGCVRVGDYITLCKMHKKEMDEILNGDGSHGKQ